DKADRANAVSAAKKAFLEEHFPQPGEEATYFQVQAWRTRRSQAKVAIHDLEEQVTRQIIRSGSRTDGRRADQLRSISCETGVLPQVHGSALFTRGETQALVTATLGTGRDEQIVDGLG